MVVRWGYKFKKTAISRRKSMTHFTRRQFTAGVTALGAGLASHARPSLAQAYPSQDVHFICGFAPGSGPDIITRFISEKMRPLLKHNVIVDNKVGAVGNIATEFTARSKPDGHVIYITGGSSLAASAYLFKNPPVDIATAIDVVGTFSRHPLLVVVRPNSPYKTVAELTAAVKAKGDKASYGTAFPTARVAGALYRTTADTRAVEVQYRTSADWINDLANGQLDYAFLDTAAGVGQIRAGRLRAIAVTSAERAHAMPEYPTMKEAGYTMDIQSWWAGFIPTGVPKPIVEQINGYITQIALCEEGKRFFQSIGMDPWTTTLSEARNYYQKDIRDWAEYVKIAKIEPQG
jgi:tripartite-type tricarboxylate transporter receptor subunit TctC